MPPAVAAAGIIGAASVGSAVMGSSAAKKAANAQAKSAAAANALEKQMFDKQVELNEPFRQAGMAGQNRILDFMGLSDRTGAEGFGKYAKDFSMAGFEADPGYDFRFKEGMKALNNSMASRGLGISGAAIKGAQRYGQDMASQEYQNAFNRYQVNRANQLNPLQSLSGAGQTAAGTISNAAGGYGARAGENLLQAGNARASGYIGSANAISGAISGGLNAAAGMFGGGIGRNPYGVSAGNIY